MLQPEVSLPVRGQAPAKCRECDDVSRTGWRRLAGSVDFRRAADSPLPSGRITERSTAMHHPWPARRFVHRWTKASLGLLLALVFAGSAALAQGQPGSGAASLGLGRFWPLDAPPRHWDLIARSQSGQPGAQILMSVDN